METTIQFTTGTATICAFDPDAINHRLNDLDDWWSDPQDELEEVNKGNVLFVSLGSDGQYTVHLSCGQQHGPPAMVSARLRCPGGSLFVGPGEQVSAGGVGPNTKTGGMFIQIRPGNYSVALTRLSPLELEMRVDAIPDEARNNFDKPLAI